MSSKLHRGGVPMEPIAWRSVGSIEDHQGLRNHPASVCTAPASEGGGEVRGSETTRSRRCGPLISKAFRKARRRRRQEQGAQVEAMNVRMARTIEEMSGLRQRFRHEAEEDVVALAIAIARRILHRELTVAPEALLGLLKAALEKIEVREVHRVRFRRRCPHGQAIPGKDGSARRYRGNGRSGSETRRGHSRFKPRRVGRLGGDSTRGDRARLCGPGTESLMKLAPYYEKLAKIETCRWTGAVTEMVGLLVESNGPAAAIGDFCEIATRRRASHSHSGDRVSGRPRALDAARRDGWSALGRSDYGPQGRRAYGGWSPVARSSD